MSYPGTQDRQGPWIQGLSTSTIQDTWSSTLVSFVSANSVATLSSGLKGDWRLCPSFSSPSGVGRYESRMPYSVYSASTLVLHGQLVTWDTGAYYCGDESVLSINSDTCGYYLHSSFATGVLSIVLARCTTLLELTL